MRSRICALALAFAVAGCSATRDDDDKDPVETDDDSGAVDTDSPVDTDVPVDSDTDVPTRTVSAGIAAPLVAGGVVTSTNFRAVYRIVPPVSAASTDGSVRSLPPLVLPPSAQVAP